MVFPRRILTSQARREAHFLAETSHRVTAYHGRMRLRAKVWLFSVGAALALFALPLRDAGACGGFFGAQAVAEGRLPSLSYEQTLIVYDRKAHHEDFVREVVFRRSRDAFGFVVPAPSRPDVASFGKDVFFKLGASFPFVRPGPPPHAMAAAAALADPGGVEVLEVKQVGASRPSSSRRATRPRSRRGSRPTPS
jgi:hypothetical protein